MSQLEERFNQALELEKIGGYEREFTFNQTRRFRFDFAWPDKKLAVEIEGGIHNGTLSGHNSYTGINLDAAKLSLAAALGWRVMRFTSPMVNKYPSECIDFVKVALANPTQVSERDIEILAEHTKKLAPIPKSKKRKIKQEI